MLSTVEAEKSAMMNVYCRDVRLIVHASRQLFVRREVRLFSVCWGELGVHGCGSSAAVAHGQNDGGSATHDVASGIEVG